MTEDQVAQLHILAMDYRAALIVITEWDTLVAYVESLTTPDPTPEPPHKDRYL